jgi:hypothetical protein
MVNTATLFDCQYRQPNQLIYVISLINSKQEFIPLVQEAGWVQGPIWRGAENLSPTGIRFPDRPVRSQSLYQLRYPAQANIYIILNCSDGSK